MKVEGDSAQYWDSPGKAASLLDMVKARLTGTQAGDVGDSGTIDLDPHWAARTGQPARGQAQRVAASQHASQRTNWAMHETSEQSRTALVVASHASQRPTTFASSVKSVCTRPSNT